MIRLGLRSRGFRVPGLALRLLLALAAVSSCRGIGCEKRDSSSTIHPETVTQALSATPHRLAVVYWPEPGGCTACDTMVTHALTRWLAEATVPEELFVLTVLPQDVSHRPRSLKLPGRILEIERAAYDRFAKLAPRPRVEIWSGPGELLMLRSIPNYSTQVALLDGEYRAARSFTAPLLPGEARGAEP